MPPTPLPPSETWELYPSLAIIILVMAVMFAGLFLIWREYKGWAREQDGKRVKEQADQRDWQDRQEKIRDERWQNFIRAMQEESAEDNERNRSTLAGMADTIRQLSENSQRLAETVAHLSETLTSHIAVDDARFDVLLTERQKAEMTAITTARNSKRKT